MSQIIYFIAEGFKFLLVNPYKVSIIFMSTMNEIFHEEMDECIVVYIDDIFVY